jgi:hypothetical protein
VLIERISDAQGKVVFEGAAAGHAGRHDTRHPGAQCLPHGNPAERGDTARHRFTGAGATAAR